MAGITLVQASAKLTEWLAADTAVAGGQAFQVNGRQITLADAKEIRTNIDYWDRKCQELGGVTNTARKIKVYGATPV